MLDTYEKRKKAFTKVRQESGDFMQITFQITGDCNMRCTYCYETKQPTSMNLDYALSLIDKLFPIEDNLDWWNGFLRGQDKNIIHFNFFGGECFLEVDKMTAIVEYFFKKCNEHPELYKKRMDNFEIICQSNGTLLQTPKVKAFLDKYKKYIKHMFITIDGSKEFHDKCRIFKDSGKPTWEIVKNNIEWYKKTYKDMPVTKGTIGPETLSQLFESYKAYKDIGFKLIKTTLRNDCIWSDKDVIEADKQYRLIMNDLLEYPNEDYHFADFDTSDIIETDCWGLGTCSSNGNGIALSCTNELYLCYNFSPISIPDFLNREHFIIGTMEKGIYRMDNVAKVQSCVDKKLVEDKDCLQCLIQQACEFCPATNYKINGNLDTDNKNACKVRKIEQKYGLLYHYLRSKIYGKRN